MTASLLVTLIVGLASPIATIIAVVIQLKNAQVKQNADTQKLKRDIDARQTQIMVLTLKTTLQGIYAMYKESGQIPTTVFQGFCDMYDQYVVLGGNSYIHTLKDEVDKMKRI